MQDDFFEKMMKSNPLGGGSGAQGHNGAQQNGQNNVEFGQGTLYKRQQAAAAGGAYGSTTSPYD